MGRPTKPTAEGSRSDMVCVGAIASAHGVRGLVTVKAFTEDPESVAAYGAVETDDGQRMTLELRGRTGKGLLLAAVSGVNDRNGAEALRGQQLYVARQALPPDDDEDAFYQADLVGLEVWDEAGGVLGVIKAVQNFGAGDILLVGDGPAGELHLPFTKAVAPIVDLATGRVVVVPPREVVAREDGAQEES